MKTAFLLISLLLFIFHIKYQLVVVVQKSTGITSKAHHYYGCAPSSIQLPIKDCISDEVII